MQGLKMTNAEQLITILNKEIIPEIDNIIDDMCELIADNKNATDEDKAEFKEAQAMKKEFKEMAFEAETGDMDEDECAENLAECKEILEEIQALGDDE
jgi:methionyl-tRNA synthetase